MTSKLTRDRLQEIAEDGFLKHGESKELARMALAAMDSEPVAEVCEDYAIRYISSGPAPKEGLHPGDKLYRHAQTAPVVEREPIAWLNDAYLARGVVDGEAGSEDAGPGYIPVYREAGPQPAPGVPVVPDGYVMVPVEPNGDMLAAAQDAYGETDGDIASTLRAAMLAATQKDVKP